MESYRRIEKMLRADREKVIYAIEALEALRETVIYAAPHEAVPRRGRKSMGIAERKQVSLRMQQYWASRRDAASTDDRPAHKELAATAG